MPSSLSRRFACFLVPFITTLLVACGGGDGGAAAGGPGAPPPGTPPAPPPAPTLVAIQVDPASVSKPVGLTQRYTAIGRYSSGTTQDITTAVTWSSSDASQVEIDAGGVATARAVGAPVLQAVLGSVASNTVTFTVTAAALVAIDVTPASATRPKGATQQLAATGRYTDGSTPDMTWDVTWASSTPAVTVRFDGLATASQVGTSVVTAVYGAVTSNAVAFDVTPAALVSLAVTPALATRSLGLTQQYRATGTYTDGSTSDVTSTATWSSSDPAKATISAAGLASAAGLGTTDIRATVDTMVSNTATLHVSGPSGWSVAAASATPREGHAAALLADGSVLVTGGSRDNPANPGNRQFLAGAERFVPASNTWAAAAPMAQERYLHTATPLPDGRVLVVGGYNSISSLNDGEIYDPATNTWSPTGTLGDRRHGHAATLLADGRVLISGGTDFYAADLARAILYDPASGQREAAQSMSRARSYHTSTLLPDGTVLVTGGPAAAAERFRPATRSWTGAGSMATPRQFHTATLLANGKVLVTGGDISYGAPTASCEIYDPATNTWSAAAAMSMARSIHTATLLWDGRVLVAGGANSSAEIYDPATNTWIAAGAMADHRSGHTATLLRDGRVFINGGFLGGTYFTSSDIYTP